MKKYLYIIFLSSLSSCFHNTTRFAVFRITTNPPEGIWSVLVSQKWHSQKNQAYAYKPEYSKYATKFVDKWGRSNTIYEAGYRVFMEKNIFSFTGDLAMSSSLFWVGFHPIVAISVGLGGLGVHMIGRWIAKYDIDHRQYKVPLVLRFDHPKYPSRVITYSLVGYTSLKEAKKRIQEINFTYSDNSIFKLLKILEQIKIVELKIVATAPLNECVSLISEFNRNLSVKTAEETFPTEVGLINDDAFIKVSDSPRRGPQFRYVELYYNQKLLFSS